MLAGVVAVVGRIDEHGVVGEAVPLQVVNDAADLCVEMRHHAVVVGEGGADFGLRRVERAHVLGGSELRRRLLRKAGLLGRQGQPLARSYIVS